MQQGENDHYQQSINQAKAKHDAIISKVKKK
jgi:hypothetical protein